MKYLTFSVSHRPLELPVRACACCVHTTRHSSQKAYVSPHTVPVGCRTQGSSNSCSKPTCQVHVQLSCTEMATDYLKLDLLLDENKLQEGALAVLKHVRPDWDRANVNFKVGPGLQLT